MSQYIVKPVFKALQVLRCLADERRELTLTEVSYRLKIPKTTTFRYLQTLCSCGFVSHDPETDLYRLGLLVWEIGQLNNSLARLRELALPAMRDLRDTYNETVNLGILDGQDVVYLEMVESRRSLRMQAQTGYRDPVYSTALGKAILSRLPEESWPEHLPKRLVAQTQRTVTSQAILRETLREARGNGFAVDDEENEEGVRCVAAPIVNASGQAVGAVSLSAPVVRMRDYQLQKAAASTAETAATVSGLLGHRVHRAQDISSHVSPQETQVP